jgi:hypothetical protein
MKMKNNMKKYRILGKAKLGDKVHSVAQPIAKVIDRVIGTEIQGCSACAKRREKLNNLFNEEA